MSVTDVPLSSPEVSREKREWMEKTRSLLGYGLPDDLDGLELLDDLMEPLSVEEVRSLPRIDDLGDLPRDEDLADDLDEVREALFEARKKGDSGKDEVALLEREVARLVRQREVLALVEQRSGEALDACWTLEEPGGPIEEATETIAKLDSQAEEQSRTVHDKRVLLDNAELALEEELAEIPELAAPTKALAEARTAYNRTRQERDRAEARLETAVQALVKLRTQMDDLAEGRGDLKAAPGLLASFTAQTDRVRDLSKAARDLDDRAFEAGRELRRARSKLTWALERTLKELQSAPSRKAELVRITQAQAQLKKAEKDLTKESKTLAQLEAKLQKAEDGKVDLQQQALQLRALPEVLKVGALLGAVLHGEALLDVEVWTASSEVLAERMGPEAFAELRDLSRAFMAGVDGLIAHGMTPEALQTLYAVDLKWPEKWWPPRLRAQERNWVEVEAMLQGKKAKVPSSAPKGFGDYLIDGVLEVQAPALNNVEEVVETLKPAWEDASKYWAPALEGISVLLSGASIWKAAGGKSDGTVRDPVALLLEADRALQTKVTISREVMTAAKTGLNMTRTQELVALVPGVGAVSELGELAANAIRTFRTWTAARADAAVHQQALEQSSRLEASADLVAKRAKSLAMRASTTTAANAITLAGYICEIAGVTAPVGTALRGVGAGVKAASKGVSKLFDLSRAGAAKEMLEKARAGDPEARSEVFRHHGRYACALVALLAHEGDPMARAILQNHDLTEEDIQKSFPLMLKRYLMVKLEESDDPTSWSDVAKGLDQLGKRLGETAAAVVELVKVGGNWTRTWGDGHSNAKKRLEAELTMVAFGADTAAYVERGVRQLEEWRGEVHRMDDLIDELEDELGDDHDTVVEAREAREERAKMHDDAIDLLGKQRGEITATMKVAVGLLAKLADLASKGSPDEAVMGPHTEARFREMIGHYKQSLMLLMAFG